MNRIWFDSLLLAIEYAKHHGGWIANCADGTVQWFDAAKWTLTPIAQAVIAHGDAEIGTWTDFTIHTFKDIVPCNSKT